LTLLLFGVLRVVKILNPSVSIHADSLKPAGGKRADTDVLPGGRDHQLTNAFDAVLVGDLIVGMVDVVEGFGRPAATPPPSAAAAFFDRLTCLFHVEDRLILSHRSLRLPP